MKHTFTCTAPDGTRFKRSSSLHIYTHACLMDIEGKWKAYGWHSSLELAEADIRANRVWIEKLNTFMATHKPGSEPLPTYPIVIVETTQIS